MTTKLAYKILVNGRSCHGGQYGWSLPTENRPGDWHEIPAETPIRRCNSGFHLTETPIEWWIRDSSLYEAEYDTTTDISEISPVGDKFSVRRVRLMRELAWTDHGVITEGDHTIESGKWVALNNARVTATNTASIRAYDTTQILAFHKARVYTRNQSHVSAYDNVFIHMEQESTAFMRDDSSATVWGGTKLTLCDRSHGRLHNIDTLVMAHDQSTVKRFRNHDELRIQLHDSAQLEIGNFGKNISAPYISPKLAAEG